MTENVLRKKRILVKRLDERSFKIANMKKSAGVVVQRRGTNTCPALTFNLSAVYFSAILWFLGKLRNCCIQLSFQAYYLHASFDHSKWVLFQEFAQQRRFTSQGHCMSLETICIQWLLNWACKDPLPSNGLF